MGMTSTFIKDALRMHLPTDLCGAKSKVLLNDLEQEVRIEFLQVLHPQGQPMQTGEVSLHGLVQQAGHLLRWPALLSCQNCAQVQQVLRGGSTHKACVIFIHALHGRVKGKLIK